ncbi:MAG: class I tRNA ligase family protein, partial [Solobacterium sp.]|nr:class I tRNA ligase family protein [Solobacterium sp.]
GSNVWFEREAKDLLPEGYTNEKSPNGTFTKETDIMDVWFDSGSSWTELEARGGDYPCDLYFEGSDQYRGWFNSSMIVGTAVKGGAPYREVLSHGYVCDSKGEKMSKSVGNVVNPMDIIKTNGADVFRLWAMNADYKQDLKLGLANIKQVPDQYRKIRNTFRFLLGNINPEDFDYEKDMVSYDNLEKVDQYILVRLNDVIAEYRKDILAYDYLSANKALMNFMVNELSSYYCDFTKDILYCDEPEGLRRRQVQSVYWQCTDALVKMWAPFLCYTAEEVWKFFGSKEEPSVHYTSYPEVQEYANAAELRAEFKTLLKVRDEVNKAIENARNAGVVGSAQEAALSMACSEDEKALLSGTLTNAPQWFIVSSAEFTVGEGEPVITRARGTKCPRCWNYSETPDENELCPRCHDVMAKLITR